MSKRKSCDRPLVFLALCSLFCALYSVALVAEPTAGSTFKGFSHINTQNEALGTQNTPVRARPVGEGTKFILKFAGNVPLSSEVPEQRRKIAEALQANPFTPHIAAGMQSFESGSTIDTSHLHYAVQICHLQLFQKRGWGRQLPGSVKVVDPTLAELKRLALATYEGTHFQVTYEISDERTLVSAAILDAKGNALGAAHEELRLPQNNPDGELRLAVGLLENHPDCQKRLQAERQQRQASDTEKVMRFLER